MVLGSLGGHVRRELGEQVLHLPYVEHAVRVAVRIRKELRHAVDAIVPNCLQRVAQALVCGRVIDGYACLLGQHMAQLSLDALQHQRIAERRRVCSGAQRSIERERGASPIHTGFHLRHGKCKQPPSTCDAHLPREI